MIRYILILMFGLTLAACATTGAEPQENVQSSLPTPPVSSTIISPSEQLRIGKMDMLSISVFGVEDLEGEYQVDYKGNLRFPLIDEIYAEGMTAAQLSDVISTKLEANYLQRADVNISIESSQETLITVEGSVEDPGLYPVKGRLTLMQAIALGGGLDEFANSKRVLVFRDVDGENQVAGFNLKDIRRGQAEDPEVFGNDIIVVDGSELKRNYREFVRSIPLLAIFRPF